MAKKVKDLTEVLIEDWAGSRQNDKSFLGSISVDAFTGYITAITKINYLGQDWSAQLIYDTAKKLLEEGKI